MSIYNNLDGSFDSSDPTDQSNDRTILDRDNPECVWPYRDELGQLLFAVLKGETVDGSKAYAEGFVAQPSSADIKHAHQNGARHIPRPGWTMWWEDVDRHRIRRVPYMLPELLAASRNVPAYIVEGEKDVDALRLIGLTATCIAGATRAGQQDWGSGLADRNVVIIPDNDGQGRRRAIQVLASIDALLSEHAPSSIMVADLGSFWSECPERGDASDFLAERADTLGLGSEWHKLAATTVLPSWVSSLEAMASRKIGAKHGAGGGALAPAGARVAGAPAALTKEWPHDEQAGDALATSFSTPTDQIDWPQHMGLGCGSIVSRLVTELRGAISELTDAAADSEAWRQWAENELIYAKATAAGGWLADHYILRHDGNGIARALRHNHLDQKGFTIKNMVEAYRDKPRLREVGPRNGIQLVSVVHRWWDDSKTERYDFEDFDPNKGSSWTEYNSLRKNAYVPPHNSSAEEGDAAPYVYLAKSNYPNEGDLNVLFSALSHSVQKPGKQLGWAPILQGSKGCGKGLMVKKVLDYCCGDTYVSPIGINEVASDFNGWARNKTVIILDEAGERRNKSLREVEHQMRDLITEPSITYSIKNRNQKRGRSFADWYILTINKEASFMYDGEDERRYAPLYSDLADAKAIGEAFNIEWWQESYPNVLDQARQAKQEQNWFSVYVFWWAHCGGAEAVRGFLERYLAAASGGRAPETAAKVEAIGESRAAWLQAVVGAIERGDVGFRGGFVSSHAIRDLMNQEGIKSLPIGKHIGEGLKSVGYKYHQRPRVDLEEAERFEAAATGSNAKIRLYYKHPELNALSPMELRDRYNTAQNAGADEDRPDDGPGNVTPIHGRPM